MGKIRKPKPVKLITGFIFKDAAVLRRAQALLKKRFGEMDFESEPLDFMLSDYYLAEMGPDLRRVFVSFKKPVALESLPKIKICTNKIELRLCRFGKRLINIDPGYLDLARLVLATTKDFNHRIYLGSGIFAEVTLTYKGKAFQPWEWTYPDYRTSAYIEIFNKIRGIYAHQIKDT